MDRRKQLVPGSMNATVGRENQEMSYSAEPSLGRRSGAGLFEPGKGIPAIKDIHGTWLHAGSAALDETGAITTINDELARWIGHKPADVLGRGLGEALAERDAECAKKFVEL